MSDFVPRVLTNEELDAFRRWFEHEPNQELWAMTVRQARALLFMYDKVQEEYANTRMVRKQFRVDDGTTVSDGAAGKILGDTWNEEV